MSGPLYSDDPADAASFQTRFDKFYTRTARLYDIAVRALPIWKTWLRCALPHIEGPRVLEVSFGTGYLLTQYADRFETHGIDYNARMVETARRNLARRGASAELMQANVESLPYEDGHFDTVINTMALSGYPDAGRAISEIRRVLKPGGRLVLIDINYPADGNWLGTRLTRAWKVSGDLVRDTAKLLAENGFEFEETEIGGFGSVHMYVCRRA